MTKGFKCQIDGCGSSLSRLDALQKHMRVVHKVKNKDERYPTAKKLKNIEELEICPLLFVETNMSGEEDKTETDENSGEWKIMDVEENLNDGQQQVDKSIEGVKRADEQDFENDAFTQKYRLKNVVVRVKKAMVEEKEETITKNYKRRDVEDGEQQVDKDVEGPKCDSDLKESHEDASKQAATFFKDWFIDSQGTKQRIGMEEIRNGLLNMEFRKNFQFLKNKEGQKKEDNEILGVIRKLVARAKNYKGKAKKPEEKDELLGVPMPKRGLPIEFRNDFRRVFEGKLSTTVGEVMEMARQNQLFKTQLDFLLFHQGNDRTNVVRMINRFLGSNGTVREPIPETIRLTALQKLNKDNLKLESMKSLAEEDEEFREIWEFFMKRRGSPKCAAESLRKLIRTPQNQ